MCLACEPPCRSCTYVVDDDGLPLKVLGICEECWSETDAKMGWYRSADGAIREDWDAAVKTYYSKQLLNRLVPALDHATHGSIGWKASITAGVLDAKAILPVVHSTVPC